MPCTTGRARIPRVVKDATHAHPYERSNYVHVFHIETPRKRTLARVLLHCMGVCLWGSCYTVARRLAMEATEASTANKVVMVGNPGEGKTAFLLRYCGSEFSLIDQGSRLRLTCLRLACTVCTPLLPLYYS